MNEKRDVPRGARWKAAFTFALWIVLGGAFLALASCGTCLLRTH